MISIQTAPSATRPPRLKPRDVVAEMARAMRELAFAGQTVDGDALANRGFTAAEVETHWRQARDCATAASIRRIS